jgi:fructose-1,6-bisphosphatase/inositol monophosphatase family enzyme
MPQIDPDKIARIIRDVAADKIMPRFKQLEESEINTKSGPTDLVTIADIEAEEDLTRIFKDILPGSHVVGEEAVSKNEINMDLLATESDPIWVVDPVDGTMNFAMGDERFGMIIALVQKGEVLQGWLFDIPRDRMGIGEKGGGVEINGSKRSYPVMQNPLSETRGFISRKFLPKKMREELKDVLDTEFGNVETYLCCAHEYLDILDGESFFSMYSRIRPWDHLAGAMMLKESGGYVRKWDRSLYEAGDQRGGVICTDTKENWQKIHDFLLKDYLKN